ncbi:unnamed protein product [Camellia sinensis]
MEPIKCWVHLGVKPSPTTRYGPTQSQEMLFLLSSSSCTNYSADLCKATQILGSSDREASTRVLRNMRAIFCGNLEYDARQSDVERLFKRYGRVDRVDMKSGITWNVHALYLDEWVHCISYLVCAQEIMILSDPVAGFAFVYMEDERDAEDAIRRLDRIEFGRKGHRLRIEWTKQERDIRRPGSSRRPSANTRPSKTLFVINFDTIHTRTRDLEKHFEPYGKVLNVRIRRNFAFIHYETQEDATRALDATNLSKLMDRVISVEYAVRDDDDRRNGNSPDRRGRDMSPQRRSYDRGGRSPSPYHRDRGSPDYGHGSRPNARPEQRGSTPYDGGDSPVNARDLSAVLSLLTNILSALTIQSFTSSKRKVSILRSRKRLPSNR